MGGLLGQIICTLTKLEAGDLNVISSVGQTGGEQCTWVRVSLKGACLPIKREEEDKQEKNERIEVGAERSQPWKSIGVDQSLCSSDGATVLPQLTSLRTDRKV